MTAIATNTTGRKLGLVIDLDTCVGCHACAVACKEWNDGGHMAPLTDEDPYGKEPFGVWFNRIHAFETQPKSGCGGADTAATRTMHFPRSCLHCEQPDCVTVCPTGASYKRAEDGIVLIDEDKCIGCKLCSWACPYGAREYDQHSGTMKKCTLCVDRIYNTHLPVAERQPACVMVCPTSARHFGDLGDADSDVSRLVAERGGVDLMPDLGYRPVNKYLPPRARRAAADSAPLQDAPGGTDIGQRMLGWVDRLLSR